MSFGNTASSYSLHFAVSHGIANTAKLLDLIRHKDERVRDVKFVEVMACPGGCVDGGGTPHPHTKSTFANRIKSIYNIDSMASIRKSHENPFIQSIYKEFLGEPCGHLAHELLHTHYENHPKP